MHLNEFAAGVRPNLTLRPEPLGELRISRLIDEELPVLHPWLQAVDPDPWFWRPACSLAALFIGATHALGASSTQFDEYKGSFRFPLLLSLPRDGKQLRYVAVLRDFRGGVDLLLYRLCDHVATHPGSTSPAPGDDELSARDIQRLTTDLIGFLESHGQARVPKTPAFHRTVESQLIIYGVRGGEAFEREHQDSETYRQALATIERDSTQELHVQQQAWRDALLRDVEQARFVIR